MENYIGKNCPFCKSEITEADVVKVCPACGIPHHEGCWKENHGCTTFGCSEQYHEEQKTNPAEACANCGTPLEEGQAFCPKCGTPKAAAPKKNICGKCGNELQDGQEFCPKCGQKAGLVMDSGVSSAINQFNAGVEKSNAAKKKNPMKVVIAAAVAVLVIVIGALALPKLIVSVEELCEQGNYEKAYEKADSGEKKDVIAENNVAVCSALTVDSLKDAKSFDLRDAWYNSESGYVVLKVAANNSYGNTVINYWLFTYDHDDDKEWELWDAYTDLQEEEYSTYDDDDEWIEKLFHNIGLGYIEDSMTSAYKLDSDSVKRVNALFAEDLLDDVDHIEAAIPEERETSDDAEAPATAPAEAAD